MRIANKRIAYQKSLTLKRGLKFPRIFYGWWNVVTGFIGLGLSYATFTVFAFGIFVAPLQAEFGWTRTEISFALTMTNIAIVIAAPCLGFIMDRIGVRRALIPSVIMMGLCVAAMSLLTSNIWYFYALFFLIPFLGAGTLPLSYSRVLIAWFSRRRGLALGISLSGFGVGAALWPIFAQALIEAYGWRMAYIVFAISVFGVSLPTAVLVLRNKPEDMGLNPDGLSAEEYAQESSAHPTPEPEFGLSAGEAAKTRSFWLIALSFLLIGIAITSILAHLVPILIDRGVAPQTAALSMTALGFSLVFGRIISGYLMDHFFAPYVTAFFLLIMALGVMLLATGVATSLVFVTAIAVGLATGSEISEIAYICSRYFGPKSFGQIYGIMFAAFQLGSAFGSPFLGIYFDAVGNYIGALWIIVAIVLVGTVLIALLGPYPDLSQHKNSKLSA